MTMKIDWMRGCATALVTPFKADGAIDEDRLRALVDRQITGGVRLLVPCGTTGESATMTEAEDQRVIAITIEVARGRARVIAGTGSNSTAAAIEYSQRARNLGADMRQTLRMVILPCIAPGVLAGAVFAFISSWDEIVVTLFISKLNIFTLPRRMWSGIRDQADPTIAACATTLIFLTILVIGSQMWLRARRLRAQAQAEGAA